MEEHRHHIFYDIEKLDKDKIIELLNEAKDLSYEIKIEELNCSKSWARKPIDLTFDEIIDKADGDTMFVFVHRLGYPEWDHYLEIGFRTSDSINYFLFICVDEDKKEYFINKYNLKKRF